MASKGISIHIGLNQVDPAAYNGWNGALSGCINDATDMKALAEQLGYSATLMTNADATADNVVAAIGKAAVDLDAQDILFLTYSGHGGQVPDVNGDEDDGLDETWVLWNRQLIDDELYALWAHFKPGVRIVVLSDSCHSGTMARVLAAYAALGPAPRGGADPFAELRATLANLIPRRTPMTRAGTKALSAQAPEAERAKLMPSDVRAVVNMLHAKENAARQYVAGPAERASANLGASVLLISGCQDSQVSMDGNANGLFTEKLKAVWNEGAFVGTYKQLADAIVAEMPLTQQPSYSTVGAPNAAFEAQSPFKIDAPKTSPAPSPAPEPSIPASPSGASGARPTLKRGDKGDYVKTLQQSLLGWEFNLGVDADDVIFGSRTESAVRAFQSTHQIEASGVVDQSTWSALG